jgi:hypothetical protein
MSVMIFNEGCLKYAFTIGANENELAKSQCATLMEFLQTKLRNYQIIKYQPPI